MSWLVKFRGVGNRRVRPWFHWPVYLFLDLLTSILNIFTVPFGYVTGDILTNYLEWEIRRYIKKRRLGDM